MDVEPPTLKEWMQCVDMDYIYPSDFIIPYESELEYIDCELDMNLERHSLTWIEMECDRNDCYYFPNNMLETDKSGETNVNVDLELKLIVKPNINPCQIGISFYNETNASPWQHSMDLNDLMLRWAIVHDKKHYRYAQNGDLELYLYLSNYKEIASEFVMIQGLEPISIYVKTVPQIMINLDINYYNYSFWDRDVVMSFIIIYQPNKIEESLNRITLQFGELEKTTYLQKKIKIWEKCWAYIYPVNRISFETMSKMCHIHGSSNGEETDYYDYLVENHSSAFKIIIDNDPDAVCMLSI